MEKLNIKISIAIVLGVFLLSTSLLQAQKKEATLAKEKKYADSRPGQPKLITINAWNEWVEASYLLPDMLHGFGYLEAVKHVFIEGKYDRY
jgi:hypothetical protein